MNITEGYMPYLGYQTYYRIAGECRDGKQPLLLLHGGPAPPTITSRCWTPWLTQAGPSSPTTSSAAGIPMWTDTRSCGARRHGTMS